MTSEKNEQEYANIANQLLQLQSNDLMLREKLMKQGVLTDGYHSEMEALHIHNANKLQEMIDQIGLPTPEKVGEEAYEAAWLIIQHAISLPAFMKQ